MIIKATIDRFEGGKAVLLVGDEELSVSWPRKLLPEDSSEGDIFKLSLQKDAEATRSALGEAKDLLRQLLEKNRGK